MYELEVLFPSCLLPSELLWTDPRPWNADRQVPPGALACSTRNQYVVVDTHRHHISGSYSGILPPRMQDQKKGLILHRGQFHHKSKRVLACIHEPVLYESNTLAPLNQDPKKETPPLRKPAHLSCAVKLPDDKGKGSPLPHPFCPTIGRLLRRQVSCPHNLACCAPRARLNAASRLS